MPNDGDARRAEQDRLTAAQAGRADWMNWGPYVSERAWGTVREDYSANGDAWRYFPHDHARSRAYRWNEDGLGGFCNRNQNLVLDVALWNERDPILKERLFGLSGPEGNDGEDVKELYYYLDSTPTYSYAKMLYKYPQAAYPYAELVQVAAARRQGEREVEVYQVLDTTFAEGRYFDVFIEYAKQDTDDVLCRITAVNRGPDPAPLHVLPHVWYRNDWSWGYERDRPSWGAVEGPADSLTAQTTHRHLGDRWWYADIATTPAELLFTENDTNAARIFGIANPTPYVKDGINDAVVGGAWERVNPAQQGSKLAAHFQAMVAPGDTLTMRVRFCAAEQNAPFAGFDEVFARRKAEADAFYAALQPADLDEDRRNIQRQAYAGLLWSQQVYHYSVELWLLGDPGLPPPPPRTRNVDWMHLYNMDVVSMPDKWEYPWYAAWDLAFQMLPLAMVDSAQAKRQLLLLLREWYMHPNGQIPAYEWNFGDVNPPVHAWAALRVYQITRTTTGEADVDFLERVFQKLLLNFTWWVNRKDVMGLNVFQGGFLGLDNIGVFDRSQPLPHGGQLEQADGTAWMGTYCLNMLAIALELARHRPVYEDVAIKFFEHFLLIAQAINRTIADGGLWDEADGFYYDALRYPNGQEMPLQLRSLVGLIPLFAVETLERDVLELFPGFAGRVKWLIDYRPDLVRNVAELTVSGEEGRLLLSLVDQDQLTRILARVLDPDQFLSPYGIRSLSAEYARQPFRVDVDDDRREVRYEPAESTSGLFGGNSNWRGPVWFPVNYLMIEALQKYHKYYGAALQVPLPSGGGPQLNLGQVADELAARLVSIFLRDEAGRRPVFGEEPFFRTDRDAGDNLLFYEYFHGDNGAGLGASHQTGWTALVATLIQQLGSSSPDLRA